MKGLVFALALVATAHADKLPSRALDDLNWMELQKIVPSQVNAVLLTVGTLEPHGVINNGADNTAPVAIAHAVAESVNALIAPHIAYGVTGALAPYPGGLHVAEEPFRAYVRAVLDGLVHMGFRRIVILNGHGGPQTAILEQLARDVSLATGVQTLCIQWWKLAADVTQEVFGEDGGHAGINETAFIQAINPKLVKKQLCTGKDIQIGTRSGIVSRHNLSASSRKRKTFRALRFSRRNCDLLRSRVETARCRGLGTPDRVPTARARTRRAPRRSCPAPRARPASPRRRGRS